MQHRFRRYQTWKKPCKPLIFVDVNSLLVICCCNPLFVCDTTMRVNNCLWTTFHCVLNEKHNRIFSRWHSIRYNLKNKYDAMSSSSFLPLVSDLCLFLRNIIITNLSKTFTLYSSPKNPCIQFASTHLTLSCRRRIWRYECHVIKAGKCIFG